MKKLLISLLVTGVLVGAVYGAAAGLNIDGTSTTVTDLVWTIDGNDITLVSGAVVELTGDADDVGNVCDVGLKVKDGAETFDGVLTVTIPASPWVVSTAQYDLATGLTIEVAGIGTGDVTITLACDD